MPEVSVDMMRERHAELERKIAEQLKSPVPDMVAIGEAKREKLALKDKIVRFRHEEQFVRA
jgi:hypothetical protein